MDGVKSLLASRTFWGIFVSFLGKLLAAVFGYEMDDEAQAQLVSLIMLAVSMVGDGIALFGRVKATKVIGKSE